jgi:iron(III) transport system ATP-binding protein
MSPLLSLADLSFEYDGQNHVCHQLNLDIAQGEIACLLGPSGCGKTTVLRLIAGFEHAKIGTIVLNGRTLASSTHFVLPEQRGIGYVFQDFALFPHLRCDQNIAFGIRALEKTARKRRVEELLNLVGMQKEATRYPHEISGGQRQRIALARALAPRPTLLLLDEPFSNLDVDLRSQLGLEVRALLKSLNMTALFVTHDQQEAFAIADTVSVMNAGTIEQSDNAYNLYHNPATRFVADFIGQGVLIAGRGTENGIIETEIGPMKPHTAARIMPNQQYDVLLRPDDIQHDDQSSETAQVINKAFRGADILYTLRLKSGTELLSLVPSHHNHDLGQWIGIRTEIDHVVAFSSVRKT